MGNKLGVTDKKYKEKREHLAKKSAKWLKTDVDGVYQMPYPDCRKVKFDPINYGMIKIG